MRISLFILALLLTNANLIATGLKPVAIAIDKNMISWQNNSGEWLRKQAVVDIQFKGYSYPGLIQQENMLLREAYLPVAARIYKINSRKVPKDEYQIELSIKNRGLFSSDLTLSHWQNNSKLERKPVYYDTSARRQAMSLDSRFVIHKHDLLFRKGNRTVKVATSMSKHQYFTTVYSTATRVYLGTSLNGLYYAKYNPLTVARTKLKFKGLTKGLPYIPHSKSFYLFEEITALTETKSGLLFVGTSIQGALYYRNQKEKRFRKLPWRFAKDTAIDVYHLSYDASRNLLWVSTSEGLLTIDITATGFKKKWHKWQELVPDSNKFQPLFHLIYDNRNPTLFAYQKVKPTLLERVGTRKIAMASGKRLFYSSAYNYKTRKRKVRAMLKRNTYNGMVLDLKDDFGYVRYHSKIPFLREVRALRPVLDLKELVKYAHSYDKYLVARLVVFQDPVLYKYKDFAILDKYTKKKWQGTETERWIDPFNKDLAIKYYIPMLKELQAIGVDEIQLDYIRFPSDGSVHRCYYRHQSKDMYRSEAIENFLERLTRSVYIPIGIDVYGYHGIYRAAGVIGQDVDAFANHVDVVSPMLYSSHFGPRYFTHLPKAERAYKLLQHSAIRYNAIAKGRYLVRPYLQAFPMRNDLWGFGKHYFLSQIKGTEVQGDEGFIFWGSFAHLRRVERDIAFEMSKRHHE